MAGTKFYFNINTAPTISPAVDSSWDTVTGTRRILTLTPSNSGNTFSTGAGTINQNRAFRQNIYQNLTAGGTTKGTVRGQFLCSEVSAADNYCVQCVIRILSGDGLTIRGIVYAADNSVLSNELIAGTETNTGIPRGSNFAAVPVHAVTYFLGDALVIETGIRAFTTSGNAAHIRYTDNAGTDLPIDNSETSQFNSWVEFSDDPNNPFDPNTTPVGHPAGAGVGMASGRNWRGRKIGWR